MLVQRDTYVVLEAGLGAARGELQGPRKGLSGTASSGKQEMTGSNKQQHQTESGKTTYRNNFFSIQYVHACVRRHILGMHSGVAGELMVGLLREMASGDRMSPYCSLGLTNSSQYSRAMPINLRITCTQTNSKGKHKLCT